MTNANKMVPRQSITSRIASFNMYTFSKLKYALFGMILVVISACEFEPQIEFVVDAPVQEYYDRFIYEASIRGLDVAYETSQVPARIADIDEANVIGTCSWSSNHAHNITLDQSYWRSATDMQREFLVFHELGHCVLGRDHVDNSDANGNCISMMSSGTGNCRVFYGQSNRTRLVDELFANR